MVHLVLATAQVCDAEYHQLRLMTRQLAAGHELAGEVEPTSEQPLGATERTEQMDIAYSGAEGQNPPQPPVDEADSLKRPGGMRDADALPVLTLSFRAARWIPESTVMNRGTSAPS